MPNSVVLVQAVFASILSSSSDLFQVRKTLLVGATVIAFIGSAMAPGSKSIGRLIAAQTLIGAGLAVIPLTFTVPSEILPRKWRPSKFDEVEVWRLSTTNTFSRSGTSCHQFRGSSWFDYSTLDHRSARKTQSIRRLANILCKLRFRIPVYWPETHRA